MNDYSNSLIPPSPRALINVRDQFSCDLASLTVPTLNSDNMLHIVVLRRHEKHDVYYEPIRPGAFFCKVMKTGQPIALPAFSDVQEGSRCSAMVAEELTSFLAVPVVCPQTNCGTLTVAFKAEHAWTKADLDKLKKWAAYFEPGVCVESQSEISALRIMPESALLTDLGVLMPRH